MKRILIDTNAYVAFKKNNADAVNTFKQTEYIGINIVVLGELLSGFRGGTKESTNRKELEQFLDSPRVNLLTLDEDTAEFYARIYWEVKKKGKPIPTTFRPTIWVDVWTYGTPLRN